MKKITLLTATFCSLMYSLNANAFEINDGRNGFKLNGYGTFMSLTSQNITYLPADFRLRAQANFAIQSQQSIGFVYAIDQLALETGHFSKDAFMFFEDAGMGRIELGFTDSIATKLGVGLPDVGGLRLNDYSVLYDRLPIGGPIISNPTGSGTKYALRANFVTTPTNTWQFGLSVAPISNHFDYAVDGAIKYRQPYGKTKFAGTFSGGFIQNPHGLAADMFAPRVNADWRASASAGFNLQYNSFIWGTNVRAIYDEKPIGLISDGISTGTGISYDFLEFTASASYMLSFVGVFPHDNDLGAIDNNFTAHTGVISARYKYSQWLDVWISTGITNFGKTAPFMSAGLRTEF